MVDRSESGKPDYLFPAWPAPANIHACTTLRNGGVSRGRYASYNLASHVGDESEAVIANRRRLESTLSLPAEPAWLEQVHGIDVVCSDTVQGAVRADASWTGRAGVVCAVLTADCLPLLVCDRHGRHVAAIHAGWRGLADGIIEHTLQALPVAGHDLMAWLGPAIGRECFEVGRDVYDRFVGQDCDAVQAFEPLSDSRWHADLYRLARQRLATLGVSDIFGGQWCTYTDRERFYSYRRDGQTGRMASLIWRT